jgi:hypothetical protein
MRNYVSREWDEMKIKVCFERKITKGKGIRDN